MFEIELHDTDPILAEAAGTVQLDGRLETLLDNLIVCALVNANPSAVLIVNDRRDIVFANQVLYDWLARWNATSVYGQKPGAALHCLHAGADGPGCGLTQYCASCGAFRALTASLRGHEAVQEFRILQENSDALDLRVWATPLSIDSRAYAFLTLEDISHEKRRHALERIFFHDVLNTAGNIRGISQLLRDMPPDSQDEMVEIMGELAEQLVEEIRTQQTLVSAESGELYAQMVSVDSLALVREVAGLYAGYDAARGRNLQIAPDAENVSFDSDPVLLRRVLGNMVKNALEACAPGQTATIGCCADGDEAVFTVHNPTYMPRDVQLQMFQRSFSTKAPDRGLGTYSMKLLSERYLQGHVAFSSSPDAGTIFYARYPRRPLPAWLLA